MIELMIKGFLIGWWLNRFQPIQVNLNLLPNNLFCNMIKLGLECSTCSVFWATLIVSHNFYYAVATSMLMIFYEKTLGRIEKRVYFN